MYDNKISKPKLFCSTNKAANRKNHAFIKIVVVVIAKLLYYSKVETKSKSCKCFCFEQNNEALRENRKRLVVTAIAVNQFNR